MSGLHLMKMFCQAVHNSRCYFGGHFGLCNRLFKTTSYLPWNTIGWTRKGLLEVDVKSFCTAKEKKVKTNAKKVIGQVGRFIPYEIIQVLDQEGKNMGNMLKKDVIHMMNKENLKLISVSENAEPPMYRLLTGKELYQEQLKFREQKKQSPGPVKIHQMSFLASIKQHDFDVKRKQLIHWIEKKHHVRLTVMNSRTENGPDKVAVLQQMIESIVDCATCMAKPKERKDGRAMICSLRPLSDEELQTRIIAPEERDDTTLAEKTDTKDDHSSIS